MQYVNKFNIFCWTSWSCFISGGWKIKHKTPILKLFIFYEALLLNPVGIKISDIGILTFLWLGFKVKQKENTSFQYLSLKWKFKIFSFDKQMRSFLASDTMLVSRFTENLIPFSFSFPVDQMPRDGQQQQQHHHRISKVQISSFCWNSNILIQDTNKRLTLRSHKAKTLEKSLFSDSLN